MSRRKYPKIWGEASQRIYIFDNPGIIARLEAWIAFREDRPKIVPDGEECYAYDTTHSESLYYECDGSAT
ncbi:hypothetical protein KSX_83690 [Ktedonospora formicarum]|uniref:Uncharacterized protein n=1 Tax=Ktedonospora formicarum TaxID=2778364 RepID=A0A8J3IA34_9CHLR|nr:hypothetical protein KSX_83690 [Ktedonospora formicarum]